MKEATTYNLSVYWTRQAAMEIEQMLQVDDETAVEFVVLTLARILYTLETRSMITKENAGEYALQTLPSEWHRIIREALRNRTGDGMATSFYATREQRAMDAKRFVTYLIDYCNEKHRLF